MQNNLDYVYKTLFKDLETLQTEVNDGFITKLITSLHHYISVRLKLLEFYDKLYEVGSSSSFIDFGELADHVEKIQNEFCEPSPVDGVLRILQ